MQIPRNSHSVILNKIRSTGKINSFLMSELNTNIKIIVFRNVYIGINAYFINRI